MLAVTTATLDNAKTLVDVISEAFATDPVWTWAFPMLAVRSRFWGLLVKNALRYPHVLKTQNFEAVSVWIPPYGHELTQEDKDYLPALIEELVGKRATDVLELLQSFDDAHPHHEPHYYLSLLATQNKYRGNGYGMGLLKDGLARIDVENMPAYLESSNPINNHRYETVGFSPVATFQTPGDGPPVTGMWRDRSIKLT